MSDWQAKTLLFSFPQEVLEPYKLLLSQLSEEKIEQRGEAGDHS